MLRKMKENLTSCWPFPEVICPLPFFALNSTTSAFSLLGALQHFLPTDKKMLFFHGKNMRFLAAEKIIICHCTSASKTKNTKIFFAIYKRGGKNHDINIVL